MRKDYYLPTSDVGKLDWIGNFSTKLPLYQVTLGLLPADITSVANDKAMFSWLMAMTGIFTAEKENWTSYKNLFRNGPIGSQPGQLPVIPTLPAAPTAVAPGIFPRIAALIKVIKAKPTYTEAIGHDLGIIGAEQTVDTTSLKPILTLAFTGGHVDVRWIKATTDAIRIEVDHGTGFQLLAISTVAQYSDITTITSASTWKYRAMFLMHDELVGQWSDVVSITVG